MLVVGILLVVALLVGGLLWFNLQYGGGDVVPTTTGLPGVDPVVSAAIDPATALRVARPSWHPAVAPPGATGPATITAISTFDPDGDGEEKTPTRRWRAPMATPPRRGRPSVTRPSTWGRSKGSGSSCRSTQPMQQALAVDVINAPYQLRFFATDAAVAPTDLASWGPELGTKAFASDPETVTSAIPAVPVMHVLILLNELGEDGTCTEAHPYRGRLGEITLVG